MDLMKHQVIQGTFITRSVLIALDTVAVNVNVDLDAIDRADASLKILAELQGQIDGDWRPLVDANLPGISITRYGKKATRIRLVLDPSRPVSVGATISIL